MKPEKPKKSKIPYIFFAFFAVFITVDIAFIYIAKKTWRGTVMDDSYEKGRKYNQVLQSDKKQKDLGLQPHLEYKAIASKKSALAFSLKDKNGKIINNAKIAIRLVRPTQAGFDFDQELFFDKKNQNYQKEIDFPLIGLWRVELQALVNINGKEEIFQHVERIVID